MQYKKMRKLCIGILAFIIAISLIFIPGKNNRSGFFFLGGNPAIAKDDEKADSKEDVESESEEKEGEEKEGESDEGAPEAPDPRI